MPLLTQVIDTSIATSAPATTLAAEGSSTIPILAIVVPVVVAILGGLAWLIYRSGRVMKHIENIDKDVDDIKKEIKIIPILNDRVENLLSGRMRAQVSTGKSPIALNQNGNRILKQSKVHKIMDERFDEIIKKVKALKPNNAYQTQEDLFNVVDTLKDESVMKEILESGAFISGTDVKTVLFVGALHIRDKIVIELGFNLENLDKEEQEAKND